MSTALQQLALTLGEAAIGYIVVLLLLRLGGKRTLAQMSSFDIIVTITIGAVLGKTILDAHIPVYRGLAVIALLVGLQALVARLNTRSATAREVVNRAPVLLVESGQLNAEALQQAGVTRAEILRALREHGIGRLAEVGAVVLEADGKTSVIRQAQSELDVLEDVPR
jgi:uncharacterized membrane protein YcaP (DUF421 family)